MVTGSWAFSLRAETPVDGGCPMVQDISNVSPGPEALGERLATGATINPGSQQLSCLPIRKPELGAGSTNKAFCVGGQLLTFEDQARHGHHGRGRIQHGHTISDIRESR